MWLQSDASFGFSEAPLNTLLARARYPRSWPIQRKTVVKRPSSVSRRLTTWFSLVGPTGCTQARFTVEPFERLVHVPDEL
jgi:hypothetical protein